MLTSLLNIGSIIVAAPDRHPIMEFADERISRTGDDGWRTSLSERSDVQMRLRSWQSLL